MQLDDSVSVWKQQGVRRSGSMKAKVHWIRGIARQTAVLQVEEFYTACGHWLADMKGTVIGVWGGDCLRRITCKNCRRSRKARKSWEEWNR